MVYSRMQRRFTFKILRAQPLVFDLPPQCLDQIQVGAVGRQEEKVHPLVLPSFDFTLNLLRAVPGRVVEYNDRGLPQPCRVIVKPIDDRLRADRARGVVAGQIAPQIQQAKDVERTALLATDAALLTGGHPSQRRTARRAHWAAS